MACSAKLRKLPVLLVIALIATAVVGKPQISFEEEGEVPKPVEEILEEEPISSDSSDGDNELIQTRLGLLAGYLSNPQTKQNTMNENLNLFINIGKLF